MPIRSFALALLLATALAVPAGAGVRIALLPVSVHASGEESGYLQSGLSEMLAARLDQYEGVVVIRAASEAGPPVDAAAARAAARAAGADFVLYGAFTRFGDGASLDMRCARVEVGGDGVDAEAAPRRVFIPSGTLVELQLDTLAQKVARYAFGAGGAAPRVAGTGSGAARTATGGSTAGDFDALAKRVEELERTLFPPVASGETPAAAPGTVDGEEALVRSTSAPRGPLGRPGPGSLWRCSSVG